MAFVLLAYVPHLSFFGYLGIAVLYHCGISRVSSLVLFLSLWNICGPAIDYEGILISFEPDICSPGICV